MSAPLKMVFLSLTVSLMHYGSTFSAEVAVSKHVGRSKSYLKLLKRQQDRGCKKFMERATHWDFLLLHYILLADAFLLSCSHTTRLSTLNTDNHISTDLHCSCTPCLARSRLEEPSRTAVRSERHSRIYLVRLRLEVMGPR